MINFDEKMCGIPMFEPSWQDANAETAVLSACLTLVAIVDAGWHGKNSPILTFLCARIFDL
jgi:hypothetical protein